MLRQELEAELLAVETTAGAVNEKAPAGSAAIAREATANAATFMIAGCLVSALLSFV